MLVALIVVTVAITVGIAPLIPALASAPAISSASASTSAPVISSTPSGRFRPRPAAMTIMIMIIIRARTVASPRRPVNIAVVIVVAPASRRASPATPPASAFTPAPMLPCQAARSAAVVFGIIAAVVAAIPSDIITIGTIVRTGTMMSTVAIIGTSPSSSSAPLAIARASPVAVAVHVYIIIVINIYIIWTNSQTTQLNLPFSRAITTCDNIHHNQIDALFPASLPASCGPLSVWIVFRILCSNFSGTTYAISKKSKTVALAGSYSNRIFKTDRIQSEPTSEETNWMEMRTRTQCRPCLSLPACWPLHLFIYLFAVLLFCCNKGRRDQN